MRKRGGIELGKTLIVSQGDILWSLYVCLKLWEEKGGRRGGRGEDEEREEEEEEEEELNWGRQ